MALKRLSVDPVIGRSLDTARLLRNWSIPITFGNSPIVCRRYQSCNWSFNCQVERFCGYNECLSTFPATATTLQGGRFHRWRCEAKHSFSVTVISSSSQNSVRWTIILCWKTCPMILKFNKILSVQTVQHFTTFHYVIIHCLSIALATHNVTFSRAIHALKKKEGRKKEATCTCYLYGPRATCTCRL